jgi:hypothetical protein
MATGFSLIRRCRSDDCRDLVIAHPVTGEKEDCEVSEARALLADPQVRLEDELVTADPLHNKQDTMRVIAEKGGDYLIGTKDNIPKRHDAVVNALWRGEHGNLFDLFRETTQLH